MRPGLILAGTIAVAAAAGIAVSLTQRPPSDEHAQQTGSPRRVLSTPIPRQPNVQFGFSAVDDAATNQVVLFGGVDNYNATWLWNGSKWSLARLPVSPPGRFGAAAAYDPATKQILLFGGRLEPGQLVNDTWAWTGKGWKELNRGGSGPPAGEGSNMAWDPALAQMMLVTASPGGSVGAQTWLWSGSGWVREPGGDLGMPYPDMVIAFDPVSQSMLAEGCCAEAGNTAISKKPTTWRWQGSQWVAIRTSVNPIDGSLLALDPPTGRLILCACDLSGGLFPELWSWSGQDWESLAIQPVPVQPESEVADVGHSLFLLLGPATVGTTAQPVETWTLSGPVWRQLDPQPVSG